MGNGASITSQSGERGQGGSNSNSKILPRSQIGKYPVHPLEYATSERSSSQMRAKSLSHITAQRDAANIDIGHSSGYGGSSITNSITNSSGSSLARARSSRRVADLSTSTSTISSNVGLVTKASNNIYFEGNNNSNSSSSSSSSGILPISTSSASKPLNTSSSSSSAAATPAAITSASSVKLCCDKCDENHETDKCPYFKKPRDSHPDAQKNFYKKLGGTSVLPGALLRTASVVRQPGDGSCLFHSMSYGLKGKNNAERLRSEICAFVKDNPQFLISETPLSDWVRWDSGSSVSDYSRKMSRGAWGGGIEMAVTSHIKQVNIHVYESNRDGYKRISAFDYPDKPEDKQTVRVIYRGGVHYDALVA